MRWVAAAIAAFALSGCGLNVESPDLFLLTRTGEGHRLALLVNDSGTIRCNGGRAKPLPDPLLLEARGLASSLGGDAHHHLRLAPARNTVFTYTVHLQQGTISFPDTATAGGRFPRLAQLELFTVQAAQQGCGLSE